MPNPKAIEPIAGCPLCGAVLLCSEVVEHSGSFTTRWHCEIKLACAAGCSSLNVITNKHNSPVIAAYVANREQEREHEIKVRNAERAIVALVEVAGEILHVDTPGLVEARDRLRALRGTK